MAKVRWGGAPAFKPAYPANVQTATAPSLGSPGAGEALGSVGANDRVIIPFRMRWSNGVDQNVTAIRWRSATASSYVGTVRLGIRALDLSNGPAPRDTGGDTGASGTHVNPASNTNFTTTLGTPVAVAHGEKKALVFDQSAYTSGNIRVPAGLTAIGGVELGLGWTYYNGTTYAIITTALIPCVTFVGDAGGIGVMEGGLPQITAAVGTVTFASDDNPNERALNFQVGGPLWAGALKYFLTTVAGGGYDMVLYEGTTALATVPMDANTWSADAVSRFMEEVFADAAMVAGQDYYLSLKPASTTDVTMYTLTITAGDAAALGVLGLATRNGAAWTLTNTLIPFGFAIGLVASDDGAGSGVVLTRKADMDTRQAGSVDQSYTIHMIDRATGLPAEGIAHSDITAMHYLRQNAAPVSVTPANLAAINSAHADGGWEEYDPDDAPGDYRIDMPDAAQVAGVPRFKIVVQTATAYGEEVVDLTADNPRAAAATVEDIREEVETIDVAGKPLPEALRIIGATTAGTSEKDGTETTFNDFAGAPAAVLDATGGVRDSATYPAAP